MMACGGEVVDWPTEIDRGGSRASICSSILMLEVLSNENGCGCEVCSAFYNSPGRSPRVSDQALMDAAVAGRMLEVGCLAAE